MKAKINFKGKEVLIEDIEKADGIKKFTGLMFKNNPNALLFDFKNNRKYKIHSYFCKPFLAIWLNQGKIIETKLVQPNVFSISSENEFDKLIEIPFNEKYKDVVNFFLVEGKI